VALRLARALRSNTVVRHIDVSGNYFGNEGLKALLEVISTKSSLVYVALPGNRRVPRHPAAALVGALNGDAHVKRSGGDGGGGSGGGGSIGDGTVASVLSSAANAEGVDQVAEGLSPLADNQADRGRGGEGDDAVSRGETDDPQGSAAATSTAIASALNLPLDHACMLLDAARTIRSFDRTVSFVI
jgi:hypothetical protein